MDEISLVRKAKEGNKEALIKLIMNKKQDYYKLAYVYMKNEEDALDIMEDMIIVLYENIDKLKKCDAFYSWSKTILVNCCKKFLKKRKRIILLDDIKEIYNDEVVDDKSIEDKNNEIMLENHLSKLTLKHQEVIKLRYFLDLDYETIAKLIKVPVGTVKSRISIGIKKLRESLGGEEF